MADFDNFKLKEASEGVKIFDELKRIAERKEEETLLFESFEKEFINRMNHRTHP